MATSGNMLWKHWSRLPTFGCLHHDGDPGAGSAARQQRGMDQQTALIFIIFPLKIRFIIVVHFFKISDTQRYKKFVVIG
jgi:hypothetical protein